jgi:uroporphyrinogen decarboxylase
MSAKSKMSSKQRVRTTLNHQEPDRVPMMMSASTWVVADLKRHLGVQSNRDLHKALHLDVFDNRGIDYQGAVGPKYIGPENMNISPDWCGNTLLLFSYQEVVTETPYGKAHSMGKPPLINYTSIEELESFPWPQADWFNYSNVRSDLKEWADEFAIALTGSSVFQHATLYRGVNQFLLDMAMDPDLTDYVLDKMTGFYFEYSRRILEEAGDLIDIFRLADDIGAQNNLFISPRMLKRYFGHRIKKFADLAHQHDVKLMFHTDGNVRKAIPDLVEWGVDMLDPVQPEVPDMNHVELKNEFGDRLSFSGGVSAQDILPHQRVDAVRAEVKRVINELGPGGGYILSPGHPSFQGDVPVENIVAMYEAGLEYGQY